MGALVTAVIAITIAVVTAIMGIFYGGSVFTDNAGRSLYAESLNGGQQIQAAVQLYTSEEGFFPEGTSAQILNAMVDGNYLTSLPQGNWIVAQNMLVRELTGVVQCQAINAAAGEPTDILPLEDGGCPNCADTTYSSWPACSSTTPF